MPLFTVLIPSKNRANIATEIVRHTLNIGFPDMELLVIDNGDADDLSNQLRAITDGRLRVIRSGGLSMVDNYNLGIKEARGDYVYVLGDKILIHPQILPAAAQRIRQFAPQVIAHAIYGTPANIQFDNSGWAIVDSKAVIDAYIKHLNLELFGIVAPIMYRTFYSHDLLSQLSERYGEPCQLGSPDFTLSYAALLCTDSYHYCAAYKNAIHPASPSNGAFSDFAPRFGAAYFGAQGIYDFYDTIGIRYSPLQMYTKGNTLVTDFFHMVKLLGMEKEYPLPDYIDKESYVIWLYRDLMYRHYHCHFDVSDELRTLYNYMAEQNLISAPNVQKVINAYSDFAAHDQRRRTALNIQLFQ